MGLFVILLSVIYQHIVPNGTVPSGTKYWLNKNKPNLFKFRRDEINQSLQNLNRNIPVDIDLNQNNSVLVGIYLEIIKKYSDVFILPVSPLQISA